MKNFDRKHFLDTLKNKGLKLTIQRKFIVDEFLKLKGHLNTDEFFAIIKKKFPRMGYATVYRTLKIMKEAGLIGEIDVGDGAKRYELKMSQTEHHDHIYCLSCGKIEEFSHREIERLQDRIARKMGYKIVKHTMQLFGYCSDCSEKKKA